MENFEKYCPQLLEFLKRYTIQSNLLDDETKEKTLEDIELAGKDIVDYFGDELKALSGYYPAIERVFYEHLERMYDQASTRADAITHKELCEYFMFLSLKSVLKNETKLLNVLKKKFCDFCEMHFYFVNLVSIFFDRLFLTESVVNVDFAQLNEGLSSIRPIQVKSIKGNLMLYHGTDMEAYEKIVNDGYLIPTDYASIDQDAFTVIEEYNERYNNMQTGFCFFTNDLSYVLDYSVCRFGTNSIGVNMFGGDDVSLEEFIDGRLNGTSVIFCINPEKYKERLYYAPGNGEFMIKGKVDIKDAKIIFVHRNKGIISLKDEKGEKVNDLCYE